MKMPLEKKEISSAIKAIFYSKKIAFVFFIFAVFIISWISYGKAFDYYFWRDDAKVVWLQRYLPAQVNNIQSAAVARGRVGAIIFDYIAYLVLGFESQTHQTFGFILRLLNTILVYFFVKQIFQSRKVAIVASLLTASYIGGLEAYSWVRGIGMMITLGLLAFTFYLKSYYSNNKIYFVLALIFTFACLSIDVWRTLGIILVIFLWELFTLLSKDPPRSNKRSVIRIAIFTAIQLFFLRLIFLGSSNAGGTLGKSASGSLISAFKWSNIEHFLISIGNLVRIPFWFVQEEGGLADAGTGSLLIGIAFLLVLIILTVRFIITRNKGLVPIIVFMLWVPIFYGPNWLYEKSLEVASTHRYLAFSAITIPILWSKVLVSKVPYRIGTLGIILFVVFSLRHASIVTQRDYTIRGRGFVLPVLNKVTQSIPIGETNSLISISGDNRVIGYVFQWSDTFPIATLKGIKSLDMFPVYANTAIASSVICNPATLIHNPITGGTRPAGDEFSISKVHSFNIKSENEVVDISNDFRLETAKISDCLWRLQNKRISDKMILEKTAVVPLKGKEVNVAVLLNWKRIGSKSASNYLASYYLNGKLVETAVGKIIFDNTENHISFDSLTLPSGFIESDITLEVAECGADCFSNLGKVRVGKISK